MKIRVSFVVEVEDAELQAYWKMVEDGPFRTRAAAARVRDQCQETGTDGLETRLSDARFEMETSPAADWVALREKLKARGQFP